MDGCVSVGGVKIDDSVSYAAAACWAGVIDNENHINSLSLWANGGHSKGSAKIVMLRGRTDTLRWRLDRTEHRKTLSCNLSTPSGQTSTSYPQVTPASNP